MEGTPGYAPPMLLAGSEMIGARTSALADVTNLLWNFLASAGIRPSQEPRGYTELFYMDTDIHWIHIYTGYIYSPLSKHPSRMLSKSWGWLGEATRH